jgi:hypothetical protein
LFLAVRSLYDIESNLLPFNKILEKYASNGMKMENLSDIRFLNENDLKYTLLYILGIGEKISKLSKEESWDIEKRKEFHHRLKQVFVRFFLIRVKSKNDWLQLRKSDSHNWFSTYLSQHIYASESCGSFYDDKLWKKVGSYNSDDNGQGSYSAFNSTRIGYVLFAIVCIGLIESYGLNDFESVDTSCLNTTAISIDTFENYTFGVLDMVLYRYNDDDGLTPYFEYYGGNTTLNLCEGEYLLDMYSYLNESEPAPFGIGVYVDGQYIYQTNEYFFNDSVNFYIVETRQGIVAYTKIN